MDRIISSDRVRIPRQPKNRIIIAAEGSNKTERIYFSNFYTGKEKYTISFAKGNDTDPLKLVIGLEQEIKKHDLDLQNGDKVYCIFDVDINPDKNRIIKEAKNRAKASGIEIISSTPSIELWFLLHYEYTTSSMTNKEVIQRLKTHLPIYDKSKDIYQYICANTHEAIDNAKKLELYQKENNAVIGFTEANPNTEAYKIVEYLIQNR